MGYIVVDPDPALVQIDSVGHLFKSFGSIDPFILVLTWHQGAIAFCWLRKMRLRVGTPHFPPFWSRDHWRRSPSLSAKLTLLADKIFQDIKSSSSLPPSPPRSSWSVAFWPPSPRPRFLIVFNVWWGGFGQISMRCQVWFSQMDWSRFGTKSEVEWTRASAK